MTPDSLAQGVIIADNDAVIRGVLRSILTGLGQDVMIAADGDEAFGIATRRRVSLVVLDLEMPKVNGFVTCYRLRRLPGYAQTPIAILTAHDTADARRAATQIGATLFIAKPFQTADLLQTLAPHLGIDVSTQEALSQAAQRARAIAGPGPVRNRTDFALDLHSPYR